MSIWRKVDQPTFIWMQNVKLIRKKLLNTQEYSTWRLYEIKYIIDSQLKNQNIHERFTQAQDIIPLIHY